MAPHREDEPDARELQFQIRMLTEAMERLSDQVEENALGARQNRESIVVIEATGKTKSGIWTMLGGILGGGIVSLLVKLLAHG